MTSSNEINLGGELQRLRADVDDLITAMEYLPGRLASLDATVEQAHREVGEMAARAVELEASVRDVAALVKRLDARVEWLERNIRLHDEATVVELDDVSQDIRDLARIAEAGHTVRAELLDAASRSGLAATIQAHGTAGRERDGRLRAALVASRTLAETPHGDSVHLAAIGQFREAVSQMEDADRRRRALESEARTAVEQLTQDDERREAHLEVMATGDRAWQELLGQLRAFVADSVGEGALLPTWFTTVLGPIPPAEDTREWMEAATALLAYRVTYGVTDPVVALGSEPGDRESKRRRDWHHLLKRRLRELQR